MDKSDLYLNRLSRRQLLRGIGGAGVAALALPALSACTTPSAPSTGAGSAATAVPSGPKVGGELRMDILSEPQSLDPIRFNAADALRVYRLATNRLLTWNRDRKLEPDLASAMPTVSADQLTYTFKLKTGVKWHDGKLFDSADVKFTYETILKPEVPSIWKAALPFFDSIEAPDPQTVIVKIKQRYTPIMAKFALIPILSSKVPYVPNETYARTIIGTGPFKVTEWQQGSQIVLDRNPEYFVSGKPYLQRIVQRVVKENAARVTNVVNGQTGLITEAPNNEIPLLKQRGVTVNIAENSTFRAVIYPALRDGSPTKNVDLRRAIQWSIDRQRIIDQVFNGAAVPAATYLSSGSDYFDQRLGTTFGSKPDLAKARESLQKAGGAPDRELVFVVFNTPEPTEIAQIVQANLRAVGINVRLSVEEGASYTNKILNNVDYDLILVTAGTGASSGFAPDYVYNGLLSTSPNSFNRGGDAKMDELLTKAVQVPENEAQAAWRAVQEYDLETLYQLQLVTYRYVEAHGTKLMDYKTSDLGTPYDLYNAWLA